MNLVQCQIFLKVLEYGTLTRAAEELGYTQSGLTRMLNALDREIGFPLLFSRPSRCPSDREGKQILPHIQALVGDNHRLLQCAAEIMELNQGLITVGTFNSVSAQWLPGMIKEFVHHYPGVKFQLLHGNNDQIVEWVCQDKVDLGFTRYGTASDFEEVFLYRDPIVGVFAADDPYARRKSFRLEELKKLPYVALNEGVDDEITDILSQSGVVLQPSYIESDDHAVIAMVEQGLGTSLMSQMMLQGFRRNIAAVPLNPPRYREIGMACRDKQLLSSAASAFWEHAISWVKGL